MSQARIAEMIQTACKDGVAQADIALLRQAVELARPLETLDGAVELLMARDWLPWPERLLAAITPDEDTAALEGRRWLCDCAEIRARQHASHAARRRIADNVAFARQVIDGKAPTPTPEQLAERCLDGDGEEPDNTWSGALADPDDARLPGIAAAMLSDLDSGCRDLITLRLQERVSARLAGESPGGALHRALCRHLWKVVELSPAGIVVDVLDPGAFRYLIDTGKRADPDALLSALALFRWTESSVVLLSTVTDGDTAADQARQWGSDCLGRMPAPPTITERSASRFALRAGRAARAAAESPASEHAWQNQALLTRFASLLLGPA